MYGKRDHGPYEADIRLPSATEGKDIHKNEDTHEWEGNQRGKDAKDDCEIY